MSSEMLPSKPSSGQSSSASKAIGTLAESLLEALRERAAADVDRLRKATSESKRKAAADKRQRMLQSMGMKADQGGGGKVIVASKAMRAAVALPADRPCHACGC